MAKKSYEFEVSIRFEAKDHNQALRLADKIAKLLEHGSPSEALSDLGIEARFADVKNIHELKF